MQEPIVVKSFTKKSIHNGRLITICFMLSAFKLSGHRQEYAGIKCLDHLRDALASGSAMAKCIC